jgi:hypothetical protein
MTNHQDAKTAFNEALQSGQEVPVTVSDPISQRIAAAALTSGNTGVMAPQLMGAATGTAPAPRSISDSEVRQWVYEHVRAGDTRGETLILNSDTLLEPDDMLFKRIESLLGRRVIFVQDAESRYQKEAETLRDSWEPEENESSRAMTNEEMIEAQAQARLNNEVANHQVEKRYQELRAQAVKDKLLPKAEDK